MQNRKKSKRYKKVHAVEGQSWVDEGDSQPDEEYALFMKNKDNRVPINNSHKVKN